MLVLVMGALGMTAHGYGSDPTSAIPEGNAFTLDDIADLIRTIVDFFLYAAGILMVGALILSGIIYATAGGSDTRVDLAKNMFKNALIGAAIILGVGAILWTLNGLITGEFFGY